MSTMISNYIWHIAWLNSIYPKINTNIRLVLKSLAGKSLASSNLNKDSQPKGSEPNDLDLTQWTIALTYRLFQISSCLLWEVW